MFAAFYLENTRLKVLIPPPITVDTTYGIAIPFDIIDQFVRFKYTRSTNYVERRLKTMSITATELKANLGKYLLMAATEDVYVTRNGRTVAKLTSPYQNKLDTVDSLFGSIPADMTLEESKEERLNRV